MSEIIHNPATIDFDKPGKHFYEVAFHLDGTWGYAMVPLCVINGTAGPRQQSIACFGGTHGNEYEGQVSVWRMMHDLDPAQISGQVILIPRHNQPACVAGMRPSPLDGVNLNRAFPGDPKGTVTYRIAHFVTTHILPRVNVVIDVHAAGSGSRFALCTSFHMVSDQKQFDEMAYVASLFDTPFVFIYSSEMASGLLTDQAEAMGKITIGGEFGHSNAVSLDGVRHAYEGIKNVLRHYGILPGEIVRIDPARTTPPRLVEAPNLEDYVPCQVNGVWEPVVQLGADVEAGELLGRLHDFSDHSSPSREIRAHRSGVVTMMYFPARVKKGLTLYMIAQEAQL